jgi:hypothetical protein
MRGPDGPVSDDEHLRLKSGLGFDVDSFDGPVGLWRASSRSVTEVSRSSSNARSAVTTTVPGPK